MIPCNTRVISERFRDQVGIIKRYRNGLFTLICWIDASVRSYIIFLSVWAPYIYVHLYFARNRQLGIKQNTETHSIAREQHNTDNNIS